MYDGYQLVIINFSDSMYNIEQLRMFVTAAELGSFSACARRLDKVQSAVSQGIANLEIDLNVQLFDRTTRKPGLTKEGKHLLTFAHAILQQTFDLENASKALSNNEESVLRLVIDDGLQLARLDVIIDKFSSQFPATSLELFFAASSDIVSLITEERADIGLMYTDMSFIKEVNTCYIGNVPFVAVVSPTHPLTALKTVTASQLIPHRQLMQKGLANHQLTHLQPLSTLVWWGNDYRMLRDYVYRGIGWCFLPIHLIDKDLGSGKLHALTLSFDHKPWSVPVERVTPKNRSMGPACLWLTQQLTSLLE